MSIANIVWLVLFWFVQIVANVLFKFGSSSDARWLPCFLAGNAVGIAGIWFLMKLYSTMNPNVALGIACGGGLLCVQVALAVIFRSSVSVMQGMEILAIVTGMTLLAIGDKTTNRQQIQPPPIQQTQSK